MLDFQKMHDIYSPQLPVPSMSEGWEVSYQLLPDNGSVRMSMLRRSDDGVEVAVDIIVPPAVLMQSQSAVSDWLLMQLCL
jgi:hypothetical protein